MDSVLCLRETTHFQSMEFERPEAICGLESGTRSRLWSTRGDCAGRPEVAFFGLRLARTEIVSRHNSVRLCSGVRLLQKILFPEIRAPLSENGRLTPTVEAKTIRWTSAKCVKRSRH